MFAGGPKIIVMPLVSVCPFVRLFLLHRRPLFCMYVARQRLKVYVIAQGQRSMQKRVLYMSIHCRVLLVGLIVLIDGRSSWFPVWRHQLPASAARRAAWRGSGGRRRSPARVFGMVTRLVWPRSSIESSFFSFVGHSINKGNCCRVGILGLYHVTYDDDVIACMFASCRIPLLLLLLYARYFSV